ncbi:MAG: sugar transferase [Clostridia bacterium]|nr:sugar transferase [Clostridia bacterium]
MKSKSRADEFRKMIMFTLSILILLSLTVAFGYTWVHHINVGIIWAFFRRGNYLIFTLYFVLQYVLSRIYGALKIDLYRVSDIVYSQGITTLLVDAIMYAIMSLVARKMVAVAPVLILFLVQMGIILIWAYLAAFVYRKLYPPYRLVIVYSYHSATSLVRKMSARDDRFIICEAVNIDEGYDYIKQRINEYDGAIICDIPGSLRNDILKYCYDNGKRTYVTPKVSDIIIRSGENLHVFDTPLLLCRNSGLTFEQKVLKRIVDVFLSVLALVLTSPFMLLTAILIKAHDHGPVFYKQARVTQDGKVFDIIKFRSMIPNAEADGKSRPAVSDDERITPVGRVIRAIRFDEMPQIFNILKGDMSIVGPRPERVEHVEKYTAEFPEFAYRLKVKAGLTGYAQVYGKYNTTAYDKLKLDLFYIENYSLRTDLRLIFMTIKVLFMKESTEGFDKQDDSAASGAPQS